MMSRRLMTGSVEFEPMISPFGRDPSLFPRAAFPVPGLGNCPDRMA
jgi:hypothetical protein